MRTFKGLIARVFLVLCSQNFCVLGLQAQTTALDDLFALARERATSIQIQTSLMQESADALQAARAQRLPELSGSVSVSYLGDGTLWDRKFRHGRAISMPHLGESFAIEAQQIVYSGGAISAGIRLAEHAREMATIAYEGHEQEVRFVLAGHYLDLCRLRNRQAVLQSHLALTDEVLALTRARLDAGTALSNDVTRYELQREQLLLAIRHAEDEENVIQYALSVMLHEPADFRISPDTAAVSRDVEFLTEDDWLSRARQNAASLRSADVSLSMAGERLRMERSALRPKISVFAADQFNAPVTIEVPALNKNFNYWYFGVELQFQFSALYKNRRTVAAARQAVSTAQLARSEASEQMQTQVQQAHVGLLTAQADLRTCQKSVQLAEENYALIFARYEAELALLTDMLDASDARLQADLALADARLAVAYQHIRLRYITGTL